jgi:hypothetical protein
MVAVSSRFVFYRSASSSTRRKRLPYHFGYGLPTDAASLAVFGLKPVSQRLYALAGIAGTTATRDVLSSDQSSVIHDMFPTWAVSSTSIRQSELDAAIDTRRVPPDNLLLKRSGYVPSVHASSSCFFVFARFAVESVAICSVT